MTMGIRIAPYGKFRKLIRDMSRIEKILEGRRTQEALKQLAEAAKGFIVKGIEEGRDSWDDLNDVTKLLKGKETILIDTGSFINAMSVWQEGKRWYAGIPEGAKGSRGQDLTVVGMVHENGATVPVTDGVRGFFAAKGFPLKPDTKFLMVPPRPWFAPAVEELNEFANEILDPLITDLLKEIG
jgi:hypothetical protein